MVYEKNIKGDSQISIDDGSETEEYNDVTEALEFEPQHEETY